MQFYSKALIEENGDQWAAQNPIYGTGPFRFVDWTPDQDINSVRNDDYWQPRLELENPSGSTGLPYFKNLSTKWIPEPQARLAALEVGEIDFAGQIPWDLVKPLLDDEDFSAHTHSFARGLYVAFPKNKANNPLNPDEPNPFATSACVSRSTSRSMCRRSSTPSRPARRTSPSRWPSASSATTRSSPTCAGASTRSGRRRSWPRRATPTASR